MRAIKFLFIFLLVVTFQAEAQAQAQLAFALRDLPMVSPFVTYSFDDSGLKMQITVKEDPNPRGQNYLTDFSIDYKPSIGDRVGLTAKTISLGRRAFTLTQRDIAEIIVPDHSKLKDRLNGPIYMFKVRDRPELSFDTVYVFRDANQIVFAKLDSGIFPRNFLRILQATTGVKTLKTHRSSSKGFIPGVGEVFVYGNIGQINIELRIEVVAGLYALNDFRAFYDNEKPGDYPLIMPRSQDYFYTSKDVKSVRPKQNGFTIELKTGNRIDFEVRNREFVLTADGDRAREVMALHSLNPFQSIPQIPLLMQERSLFESDSTDFEKLRLESYKDRPELDPKFEPVLKMLSDLDLVYANQEVPIERIIEGRRFVIEFVAAHPTLARRASSFPELERQYLRFLGERIPAAAESNQYYYGRNILYQIYGATDDFAEKAITLFKTARPSVLNKVACENPILGEAF